MKLIKMLGLTAVAAVAAMAFVGTSSAFAAEHTGIGLCKAEELLLCANLITPKAGDVLLGTQEGVGKFTGSAIGTEECTVGKAQAEPSTEVMKKTYEIKNLKFTFENCKPCKKVTVATVPKATVSMPTEGAEPWELSGEGKVVFSECTFGLTCEFGAVGEAIHTLIKMEAGKLAFIDTNGTTLKFTGGSGGEGLCGSKGQWFAKFNLSYHLGGVGGEVDDVWPTLLIEA